MSESEKKRKKCSRCGGYGTRMAEPTTMRPDNMWAGVMTENYGYITSKSHLEAIQRQRHHTTIGDRADLEAMKKTADQARADIEAKEDAEDLKYWENALSGAGLVDSFGEVTPDANRKLSDKPLNTTKDERVAKD